MVGDMDGDALYSIGDLAQRTGLTVKAIRFYSDRGIVPPTDRTPTGYRRYNTDAIARLDLVRTLRDLGVDLPTIRRVVDRELSLPEVAAAHVEALAVQIATLRLRRAVLAAVATAQYAYGSCRPDDLDLRRRLLIRLETANDPRREQYFQLLSVINGWPTTESLAPALDWFIRALRARMPS